MLTDAKPKKRTKCNFNLITLLITYCKNENVISNIVIYHDRVFGSHFLQPRSVQMFDIYFFETLHYRPKLYLLSLSLINDTFFIILLSHNLSYFQILK